MTRALTQNNWRASLGQDLFGAFADADHESKPTGKIGAVL
jgi:hypothetical protein